MLWPPSRFATAELIVSRFRRLPGRAVLMLSAAMVTASASAQELSYHQLVEALDLAPNAVRAEFALAALAQLDHAYAAEAARSAASGSLRGWRSSVDSYRVGLRALSASIDPQTTISLRTGVDRRTQLLIADTVLIVSSPRAAQQAQLERAIKERFCARYLCDQLPRAGSAKTRSAGTVTFGFDVQQDAGLSCNSGDGLQFLFFTRDRVAERRSWCQQIVAELRTLGWSLRQRVNAGVVIEWQYFAVEGMMAPAADAVELRNRVQLNSHGDSLSLALPRCAAAPQLISRLLPWLSMRADGLGHQGIELVITNTEALIEQ